MNCKYTGLSVALLLTLTSTAAFANSSGEAKESEFEVSVDGVVEIFENAHSGDIRKGKLDLIDNLGTDSGAAVRLIYFDTPTNPNHAALQKGTAPTPGTYCLTIK
ncbi:hypothetical protein [Rothia nasimurium]|uniref:hypothetical protein n=1 Tax=Rothia nasimurium TaxID=85336 RepID=UPI003BA06D11